MHHAGQVEPAAAVSRLGLLLVLVLLGLLGRSLGRCLLLILRLLLGLILRGDQPVEVHITATFVDHGGLERAETRLSDSCFLDVDRGKVLLSLTVEESNTRLFEGVLTRAIELEVVIKCFPLSPLLVVIFLTVSDFLVELFELLGRWFIVNFALGWLASISCLTVLACFSFGLFFFGLLAGDDFASFEVDTGDSSEFVAVDGVSGVLLLIKSLNKNGYYLPFWLLEGRGCRTHRGIPF